MNKFKAEDLLNKLFPICRSITGEGLRTSLEILSSYSNFNICSVETGSEVYDWKIPDEWSVSNSYIETSDGKKWAQFEESNIHIVNYSAPVDQVFNLDEIENKIHKLKTLPDAIPYRTSYFSRDWGICMSFNEWESLKNHCDKLKSNQVKVVIDSNFKKGNLYYGEYIHKGKSKEEILITTYLCHPSLANDNLSGPLAFVELMERIKKTETYYTYRFAIFPETIGAITYLCKNEIAIKENVLGGFVLTTCAGPGSLGMKHSFLNNSVFDKAAKYVLEKNEKNPKFFPFDIHGSDERQFSSPYFRIPMVTISKDKYYDYSFYHTSLDDLNFVSIDYLEKSIEAYWQCFLILENNFKIMSKTPKGEPMLGKRGLYPQTGGAINQLGNSHITIDAIMWILFYGDKSKKLLDLAIETKIDFFDILESAKSLKAGDVIELVRE